MELVTYHPEKHQFVSTRCVTKIDAAILYYLHYGRNAWHSTWIRRYYREGCLHSTLDSAKLTAEKLRGQGTTFTIEQMPALSIGSDIGFVFVTQINSACPLQHFLTEEIEEIDTKRSGYETAEMRFPLRYGTPIGDVLKAFRSDSKCWTQATRPMTQTQQVLCLDVDAPVESCHIDQLRAYKSFPQGSGYRLGWSPREARFSTRAVRMLRDITEQLNAGCINRFTD